MRWFNLRTRTLMVAVIVIALFLAWNRRRQDMTLHAEYHRAGQERYKQTGFVTHWRPGDEASGRVPEITWAIHRKAAEAFEAAAWSPWITPDDPCDFLNAHEWPFGKTLTPLPNGVLPVPED